MNWENNFTKWVGSKKSVVIHTVFFIVMFGLSFFGVNFDTVLLVLTTIVSLEAIYLAIFIQMTVNKNTASLEEAQEDIEEIVDEVTEISDDIDEIQEDVEEIQHDVDEIEKEGGVEEENKVDKAKLDGIENILKKLLEEVQNIKRKD